MGSGSGAGIGFGGSSVPGSGPGKGGMSGSKPGTVLVLIFGSDMAFFRTVSELWELFSIRVVARQFPQLGD